MSDEPTYAVTELGNAVYHAFIQAYLKKHPEMTEEQAYRALREGKE